MAATPYGSVPSEEPHSTNPSTVRRPFQQTLAAVLARVPQGIRLGVERTRAACGKVGRPDRDMPVLHVGGTNGKGSVASLCEAVLRRAGYRTGLFTSPHLCRFAERIRVDGVPLDEEHLSDVLTRALEIDDALSFFETAFVAAMLAFREAKVDVAVLEVGLGGRLDATNVVERPLVTCVTRVALDHVKQLGTTLESIAAEKAAIAKPGVPMVLGPLESSAYRVAHKLSRERGAWPVLAVGREIVIDQADQGVVVRFDDGHVLGLRPSLPGAHQIENAAVAAAMCRLSSGSLPRVTSEHIEQGIAEATWPGRLESLSDGLGRVLIDAAHNPDGTRSLTTYLRSVQSGWRSDASTALVFGAMDDKAWPEMLAALVPLASHRFYVEPPGRKAASLKNLCAQAPGAPMTDLHAAMHAARDAVGSDGLVVVAGSIFLVGRVRAMLLGLPTDPAVAL